MKSLALLLTAVLAQAPEPPQPESPAAPVEARPDAPAVPPPGAQPALQAEPAAPQAPRIKGADEVNRQIKRLKELSPGERLKLIEHLHKEFGLNEVNPVLPPSDLDLDHYADLPSIDQAKVTARHFFTALIAADSPGMLAHCGLPFMMEDRRIERGEELRGDWTKSLRAKRTDLLVLYDVEILTPAEMEKKYGPPPRRLSSWSWRGANTYLAVGNLSGRAMVLLLRPAGAAWQVVAFHD